MLEAFTEFSRATMRAPDIADGILRTRNARAYLSHATITDLESCVESDDDGPDGHETVHAAFDELQEHAPPYCYIGSHEGDGSLFGVWPCVDSAVEDCVAYDDGADIPPETKGLALIVSDHGNVTLVSCHGPDASGDYCDTVEIWGCV